MKILPVLLLLLTGFAAEAADIEWNGWSFDYSVTNSSSGLMLSNVEYQKTKILAQVSMPAMQIVEDNDSCGPYAAILIPTALTSAVQFGPSTSCYGGFCRRSFTRNGENMFELGATWQFGRTQVYQAYYFSEHGYFDSRVYSRGMQCQTPYNHKTHWIYDFDINGALNDQVTTVSANNNSTPQMAEFNELASEASYWTVQDTDTGSSVRLLPPADRDYTVHGRYFDTNSSGRWLYGARGEIADLLDTPAGSAAGSDIVLWYTDSALQTPDDNIYWRASGPRLEVVSTSPATSITTESQPDSLTIPEVAVADDRLLNGGFEAATLDGWQACSPEDSAKLTNSDQAAGRAALNLENGGCVYQVVDTQDYERLQLSCLANNPTNEWSIMTMRFLDSDYNQRSTQNIQIIGTESFSSHELAGTAPRLSKYAVVQLYSEGDALFDSCALVPTQAISSWLINGGFEDDLKGWKSCAATHLISASPDADSGSGAAVVSGGGCMYQEFDVTSMTTYQVTCRAKNQDNTLKTSLSLYQSGSSGIYGGFAVQVNSTTFQDYTGQILIGQSDKAIVVLHSEDTAVFDGCSVSIPPSYFQDGR